MGSDATTVGKAITWGLSSIKSAPPCYINLCLKAGCRPHINMVCWHTWGKKEYESILSRAVSTRKSDQNLEDTHSSSSIDPGHAQWYACHRRSEQTWINLGPFYWNCLESWIRYIRRCYEIWLRHKSLWRQRLLRLSTVSAKMINDQ